VDPRDLGLEFLVTHLAVAGFTVELVVVARWGDRQAQLGQLYADRLDTPSAMNRVISVLAGRARPRRKLTLSSKSR
jgi:hypothetical protein